MKTFELRLLCEIREYNILELPIVFTGTWTECFNYAELHGYKIVYKLGMLFNGYFAHPETKACLFITQFFYLTSAGL